MRIRGMGWPKVAMVWLCLLALVASCWMVGCGDDKKKKSSSSSDVTNPEPAPVATQPAPASTDPTTPAKKGPGILQRLGKKLTDGK